uniref:Uncharacterized protein n=1 Tax=Romanomermis culicivorax TaxID=13658 RepID=A0A915L0R5_ROMCU
MLTSPAIFGVIDVCNTTDVTYLGGGGGRADSWLALKLRRKKTRAMYTPEIRWMEKTNFAGQVLGTENAKKF